MPQRTLRLNPTLIVMELIDKSGNNVRCDRPDFAKSSCCKRSDRSVFVLKSPNEIFDCFVAT